MTSYITKKDKPKYITKKPKKQYITRKSAKPKGSGVEDTSGKTLWITKKEKPKYITKKEEPKAWITKKVRTGVPHFNTGGRATHGYGRAYMKGGKV